MLGADFFAKLLYELLDGNIELPGGMRKFSQQGGRAVNAARWRGQNPCKFELEGFEPQAAGATGKLVCMSVQHDATRIEDAIG